MGSGRYRVHDLLLEFVTTKLQLEEETAKRATELQAQYLGRLDVVEKYDNPEHGAGVQGFYSLAALWRSVEELSGDLGLEVASYRASLGELEACETNADVACLFSRVGRLFELQVRCAWNRSFMIPLG